LGLELEKLQYELVDIEWQRHPQGELLRIFIDKPGGVNLDDCARASEAVSRRLDELDVIDSAYNLEVSSPGVERPLKKPKDWQCFIGERIAVKTIKQPDTKRRNFQGILRAASDEDFEIEVDGRKLVFKYSDVKKAHLLFEI